jgi:hypothetical protein
MASTSSYFDPTSLFIEVASEIFSGVMTRTLITGANGCNTHLSDFIRVAFGGEFLPSTKLNFKRCLIDLLRFNCKRYLSVHQQIIDKKLEKSDLNQNDPDHRHYSALEKLMSQNNGYKHLNCLYDGLIMFCMLQFKYVSTELSHYDIPRINLSSNHSLEHTNSLQLYMVNRFLQEYLTKANENLQNLYGNDDEYKHYRLKCKEDDSCQLSIENLQQLLKDQQESIEQQIREFRL